MPHQGVEKPRSENCLRHRSSALRHSSHTVRGSRHTPAAVSRWSKIDRIDHLRHFCASQPTPEPHPHREPAIFRMRDLIHTHHRRLHRCGSPCARSRARPAMSIACVVSDAHACGPSVYLGGGDAERARIRLIGRSKTARCNWRSDFRKQVFPLAHAHPPFRPCKEGSENFFSETASTAAPRWSTLPLEAQACRIQAVSALVRR